MSFYKNKIILFAVLFALITGRILFAITPVLTGSGTGRTMVPVPLLPGDTYGLATMEQQKILVDLYPGLALVKSEILLANRGKNAAKLLLGLPKCGSFSHNEISVVKLDSLYNLKVFWRGKELLPKTFMADFSGNDTYLSLPETYRDSVIQWYGWELDMQPVSSETLEIIYAVKTGPAELTRGANIRRAFFFGFLLEQARAWNGPMQKTEMQIRLKGGLSKSRIFGIYPKEVFQYDDEERLYYRITGRSPIKHDDVLIGYQSDGGLNLLADYLQNEDKYFNEIYQARIIEPESSKPHKMPPGNFDVYPAREYLIMGALALCFGLVTLLIIYLIRRN